MQKLITGLMAGLLGCAAFASDHIDGPVTTKHRVGDLSDLYAFPTPGKTGHLTLILNTYPVVEPSGHFSDKVTYTLFLRKAAIRGSGDSAAFATSDEVSISCSFVTPPEHEGHTVTCKSSNGLVAENQYQKVTELRSGDSMRVFAGMRSDPFFFNAGWAKAASTKGTIKEPKDDNVMRQTNILSLVVELEAAKLFGGPVGLLAVAAEATTRDSESAPVRRLDRLGRAEITNVSLVAHEGEADLRDKFNEDRPFQVAPANQRSHQERLAKNIKYYDGLDKKQNWEDRAREAMAAILADDFLVLDLTKPCEAQSFLEIEQAMVKHRPHGSCGGRKLTDDIMDIMFTAYIAGIDGKPVRDGVDKPYAAISPKFPYLAEPDLSAWGRTRAFIARKLLGL